MQAPLDPYRGGETSPGDKVKTDAEIDAWLKRTVVTAHHPASTCAMGTREDCVLDPQMRVRGMERLARGRCLSHAGPGLGPYQRDRADDGGKGAPI